MTNGKTLNQERRKALKLLGIGAATIPLAALGACSSDESAPKPAAKPVADKVEEKATEVAEAVKETVTEAAEDVAKKELPVLAANDPQATSLGYVPDASNVDAAKYPRFAEGQACSNCALYMGGDADKGPCSIFPGKAVMAAGWCSVYAPKAS